MTSKKLSSQEVENLIKMLDIYLNPIKGVVTIIANPEVLHVTSRDASGNILEKDELYYYEINIKNDIKELSYSELIDQPLSGTAWLIVYNVWCDLNEGIDSKLAQTIFNKDLIIGMRRYD